MNYAITYENNVVFQHFGKCPMFLLVRIEQHSVIEKKRLSAQGSGHSALVNLLHDAKVDTLVCGGIGQGARDRLAANNIQLISGAKGNVDDIIEKLKQGTLQDDPNGMCHHHEDANHHCGTHDCGTNDIK